MLAMPSLPELGELYPVVLSCEPGRGAEHTVGGVEQGTYEIVVLSEIKISICSFQTVRDDQICDCIIRGTASTSHF